MEIYKIYFVILQLLILKLVSMRRTGTYDVLEVRLLRYQRQSQQPSNTMDCERYRCNIYVSMFIKVPNATRSCLSKKETYSFVSGFRNAVTYNSSLRPLQVPQCDGKKMNLRRFKDLQLQLDVSRNCSALHVKCEPFTSNYTYEIRRLKDGKESHIGVDIERTGMRLTFGFKLNNDSLEDLKHVRTHVRRRAAVIHYNTSSNGTKICHKGWTGLDCNHNIDDCVGSLCYNGGTCKDKVNGYICMCGPDFTGYQCENGITTTTFMMKSTVLPKTSAPLVKSTLLPKTTGLLVRTTLLPKTTTLMVKITLLPPKTTTSSLVKPTLLPETTSLMVKTTLLPKTTTSMVKTTLLPKTAFLLVKTTLLPKTTSLLMKTVLLPKTTSLLVKTTLLPKTTFMLVKTTLLPQSSSFSVKTVLLPKTTLLPKSTSLSRRKSLTRAVSLSSSTSKPNLATKHINPSSDNTSGYEIKKQSIGGLPWWWWIPLVAGVVLILSVIVVIVALMKCNKSKRQVTDQAVLRSFPVNSSNQGYNKQNINNPDVQKQFTLRVENISF